MKYYTYLIVLGEQPFFGICVAAGKRKQNDAQQQTRNSAIQHSSLASSPSKSWLAGRVAVTRPGAQPRQGNAA